MQKEHFVERILETENLSDELEDADANLLINWGIKQVDIVLADVTDDEPAGDKINALMSVMRKVNRLVGQSNEKTPQRWAEDLVVLHSFFIDAFGVDESQDYQMSGADFEQNLTILPTLPAGQVLVYLLQWPNWSTPITQQYSA